MFCCRGQFVVYTGFIQYRAVYKYDVCKCIFPFHISWVTERNCKVNGNLKTFTQKTSAGKHVKVVDLCNCIAMGNLMIFSSIELNNKTLNEARAKNADLSQCLTELIQMRCKYDRRL